MVKTGRKVEIYFETDKEGMISACGYVWEGCINSYLEETELLNLKSYSIYFS